MVKDEKRGLHELKESVFTATTKNKKEKEEHCQEQRGKWKIIQKILKRHCYGTLKRFELLAGLVLYKKKNYYDYYFYSTS